MLCTWTFVPGLSCRGQSFDRHFHDFLLSCCSTLVCCVLFVYCDIMHNVYMLFILLWERCLVWVVVIVPSGAARTIIGGANIHICAFCPINFFWNRLFLQSVNTNVWIFASSIIVLPAPLIVPGLRLFHFGPLFGCIRDLKIVVYSKRLTSDTLFAIKTKSLTMKYITYRIYSTYRKLSMETPCLTTETWRLTLNDFLIT